MIKIAFLHLILVFSGAFSTVHGMQSDMRDFEASFSNMAIPTTEEILKQWLFAIENSQETIIKQLTINHPDCRAMAYAYRFNRKDIVQSLLSYVTDWDMAYGYICAERDYETLFLALDKGLPTLKAIKNLVFMTITYSNDEILQLKLSNKHSFKTFFKINEEYISGRMATKHGRKISNDARYRRTFQQREAFWKKPQIK